MGRVIPTMGLDILANSCLSLQTIDVLSIAVEKAPLLFK
jgi:hypothetical protein